MPSLSPIPSAETDYQAEDDTRLNKATWNAVFGSLSLRLRQLESQKSTIEDLINELEVFGLQRLDEAIVPLINDQKAVLANLKTATDQAIDTLNANIAALEEQVALILAGGIPAASVQEDANRVFLTPAQKAKIAQIESDLELLVDATAEALAGKISPAQLTSALSTKLDAKRTFTAGEAIAAGDLLMLNAAGKAVKLKQALTNIGSQYKTGYFNRPTASSATNFRGTVAWSDAQNRGIMFYTRNGLICVRTFTIGANGIVWGAETTRSENNSGSPGSSSVKILVDDANNRFGIFYGSVLNDYSRQCFFTWVTFSAGVPVIAANVYTFTNGYDAVDCFYHGNRIVFFSNATSNGYVYIFWALKSGGALTQSTLMSNGEAKFAYDPVSDKFIGIANSGHSVISWSGTNYTVSFQTWSETYTTNLNCTLVTDALTGALYAWKFTSKITTRRKLVFNGTKFTAAVGTEETVSEFPLSNVQVGQAPSIAKYFVRSNITMGEFSTDGLVGLAATVPLAVSADNPGSVADAVNPPPFCTPLQAWLAMANIETDESSFSFTPLSIFAPKRAPLKQTYIGIAATASAVDQPVVVDVPGGISAAFTGLPIGKPLYLSRAGALTTVALGLFDENPLIGIAIAADRLLLVG